MNILMLGPDPSIRGPLPKHTPLLVDGLREVGCTVTVLTWGRTHDQQSRFTKLRDRIAQLFRIHRALRQGGFDLFVIKTAHDRGAVYRDLLLLVTTVGWRPRTALQFHGSWLPQDCGAHRRLFRSVTRALLWLSDGVLVLSTEELDLWRAFWPRGVVHVVRNPYQIGMACGSAPETAGFQSCRGDGPVLLFVGRLIEEKGILELVDAFSAIGARAPAHLLVVGEGPLRPELIRRVQAHGLDGRVTFAGYLEGEALRQAYAASDVFVLPSWSEGFSFAIMEAMEAGLPIVTSPIRGMADYLADDVHALFAPARDASRLAAALTRLVEDSGLRRRLGDAARAKLAEFSPQSVAAEYLDALRHIQSGSDRKPPQMRSMPV